MDISLRGANKLKGWIFQKRKAQVGVTPYHMLHMGFAWKWFETDFPNFCEKYFPRQENDSENLSNIQVGVFLYGNQSYGISTAT